MKKKQKRNSKKIVGMKKKQKKNSKKIVGKSFLCACNDVYSKSRAHAFSYLLGI